MFREEILNNLVCPQVSKCYQGHAMKICSDKTTAGESCQKCVHVEHDNLG
uniref:Uncharacterized protein n=1 Tax=Arion vulgaris TaxID=1028688 RepID=A0A0B7AA73_9EUPU